jgi:protein-S-isoprenylcysteine O-methyltransferase Ste14
VISTSLVFRVCARVLPASLFTLVAVLNLHTAIDASGAGTRIHQILSAILWGMFAALVVVRPVPLRRGGDLFGVLAAVGAQAGVLVLGVVAGDSGSGLVLLVANVVLAGGLLFAIASVAFLGRCFGVLPDVRGLVTRGPYRLVRHPLYLGELTAVLGVAMGSDRWAFALPVWCLCVGLQLIRTHYEERTLRAAFPEYGAYAQRTKRLIPGLV